MSIQPIDLQVNIAQQLNVGKEAQIAHDQPVKNQREIAEKNKEMFHKQSEQVLQTDEAHGLVIKEEEERKKDQREQKRKEKKPGEKEKEEEKKAFPQDPMRGSRIDIKI